MSVEDELFGAWDVLVREHGFRKSGFIHTLPLGKDWQGWLGLNSAGYRGAGPVDVLPVVGVRWKPLEQVFRELNPQLPKSVSPTLSQPLSYELVKGPHNGAQWRVRDAAGEPFQLEGVLDDVVRWRIGRRKEAVDFVREQQREAADKTDAASRDYVACADRFLEKYA